MSLDSGDDEWRRIQCTKDDLTIDITLACGQAFRWCQCGQDEWIGVFAGHVWRLKQTNTELLYKVYTRQKHTAGQPPTSDTGSSKALKRQNVIDNSKASCSETGCKVLKIVEEPTDSLQTTAFNPVDYSELLRDYFRLSVNLPELYKHWGSQDETLLAKTRSLKGVRQLRQDPVETLFTFICSSNNNITRISGMVDRMCQKYGDPIAEVDGKMYCDFPRLEVLAGDNIELGLRELGFGYRAAYIGQTAQYIMKNHSASFLHELRGRTYEEAKSELMKFHGVGAKVADCVCLMALDKLEAVPVDTHVWQLALRDYRQSGITTAKSLTDTIYRQIGDFFRRLWGPYAGWAQSVAFTAELKQFRECCQSENQKTAVACNKRIRPDKTETGAKASKMNKK